jgi:hypothetical protein
MKSGICDLPDERCHHPISCDERGCVKQRTPTAPTPPASPAVESQMQALLDYPEMVVGRARCDITRGQTIIGDMLGDDGTGSLMRFAQSLAALAAPPTPRGEEWKPALPTDAQVREAMQTAWDDYCSDAQAIPGDIYREGRKTFFQAGTWADHTAMHLRAALSTPRAEIAEATRDETCPMCEGKDLGSGGFCIANCRGGKLRWTSANVVRSILPWLTSTDKLAKERAAEIAGLKAALGKIASGTTVVIENGDRWPSPLAAQYSQTIARQALAANEGERS